MKLNSVTTTEMINVPLKLSENKFYLATNPLVRIKVKTLKDEAILIFNMN